MIQCFINVLFMRFHIFYEAFFDGTPKYYDILAFYFSYVQMKIIKGKTYIPILLCNLRMISLDTKGLLDTKRSSMT